MRGISTRGVGNFSEQLWGNSPERGQINAAPGIRSASWSCIRRSHVVRPEVDELGRPVDPLCDHHVEVGEEATGELVSEGGSAPPSADPVCGTATGVTLSSMNRNRHTDVS